MGRQKGSNENVLNVRVMDVAKLMLQGYTKRAFLIQKISETTDWQVGERQLDNYIKEAKAMLSEIITDEELLVEKGIAISRLEALYTMNMKIQDYRECRSVTMDRMKLLGVLTEKSEVNHSGGLTTTMINLGNGTRPDE